MEGCTENIRLESSDKEIVEFKREFAQMSNLIKNMTEDNPDYNETIPLDQYNTASLNLVKQFCELAEYQNKDFVDKPIYDIKKPVFKNEWEKTFFDGLSFDQLTDLAHVANYLDIEKLIDGCCAQIAILLKKNTQQQLESELGVSLTMTREEEEQLKEQYKDVFKDENRYRKWKEEVFDPQQK
ncbi:glycoprotein fp21 [Stylonychia lemnae]|uniref:Glycoprotein fp21 n=1 Tax=Stylonychia lemnae TaxID=5949 RepID=A0A078A986_STYLE|nr:glycoprotein fp21 [Stylonychia lemnae]|eukprot:CDW78406.1 glycoprotein fp21 [Stylonychia lemnae]